MRLQALQRFYLKAKREGWTTVAGLATNLHLLETLIRLAEARARADLQQVLLPQLATRMSVSVDQRPEDWGSMCKRTDRSDLTSACPQEVTRADAEDAIELVQFNLFAGSPEVAATRDFRPAGSRRTSKQACGVSHSSRSPLQ